MIRTKTEYIRLNLKHAVKSSVQNWLQQPTGNRMPLRNANDFNHMRPDCILT